jgi:hypothetical protein
MSEQMKNDKGFLKEKLGDYQVSPPEKVWNSIASQLGGRSRRSMMIITLSAAASLALAVTLGIHYFGPKLPEKAGIANTNETASQAPGSENITQAPDSENITQAPIIENENSGIEKDNTAESESKRQRETLEEKVVRALDDTQVADNLDARQNMARAETADHMEVLENQAPEKVIEEESAEVPVEQPAVGEEVSDQEVADQEVADQVSDPVEAIASDPADELQEKKRGDLKWVVGAALSPLYSFRDAEASAMGGAADFESGMVAYAGGIHVSYRTTARLSIESGIFYNKMGISIGAPGIQSFNESFDFSPLAQESGQTEVTTITNSIGNIVAKSGEVYVNNYLLNASSENNAFTENTYYGVIEADQGIRQHLEYLEIPFNLRYTVVDRTIEFQLVGGMSTNFLINNFVSTETSGEFTNIGYLTNIRSVNYSGNAGLGMIYHIRNRFSIQLEPRFRYFLNSVNDATLPSTRPYTLGIYTGLSYTF